MQIFHRPLSSDQPMDWFRRLKFTRSPAKPMHFHFNQAQKSLSSFAYNNNKINWRSNHFTNEQNVFQSKYVLLIRHCIRRSFNHSISRGQFAPPTNQESWQRTFFLIITRHSLLHRPCQSPKDSYSTDKEWWLSVLLKLWSWNMKSLHKGRHL